MKINEIYGKFLVSVASVAIAYVRLKTFYKRYWSSAQSTALKKMWRLRRRKKLVNAYYRGFHKYSLFYSSLLLLTQDILSPSCHIHYIHTLHTFISLHFTFVRYVHAIHSFIAIAGYIH